MTSKSIPFKIANDITVSFFDNLIPLTPTDDLPEKIRKSLQENLIHFPSFVERKILASSEQVNTLTSLSFSLSFIAILPFALMLWKSVNLFLLIFPEDVAKIMLFSDIS